MKQGEESPGSSIADGPEGILELITHGEPTTPRSILLEITTWAQKTNHDSLLEISVDEQGRI